MTLQELFHKIISSEPDDWHAEELRNEDGHAWIATLKSDIDIQIQWGRACVREFEEAWTQKFPNREASSEYAEVLYRGHVVLSDVYVSVDGGRALLPMPTIRTLEVPQQRLFFVGLLNALSRNDPMQFPLYIRTAGIVETYDDWPKL